MGVHGLWKLIDAAGKPVPVETLENRILAIDVSIWLHQLVKGFQDSTGGAGANAHLLGLFYRICKLLFFRIKPVFVFDGGVPALKRKTIAARQSNRSKANESLEKIRQDLLHNLLKQHALGKILGQNVKIPKSVTSKTDSMFFLPPLPSSSSKEEIPEGSISLLESEKSSSSEYEVDSESSSDEMSPRKKYGDLHSIDLKSKDFKSLPADMRHDILSELKETRKQNSWAKVHLMPEDIRDFSSFQMERLLKRRSVQVELEEAEKEMGPKCFTVSEIQQILEYQGLDVSEKTQRIASDSSTTFLYSSQKGWENKGKLSDVKGISGMDEEVTSDIDDPVIDCLKDKEDLSQEDILKIIKEEVGKKKCSQIVEDCGKTTENTNEATRDEIRNNRTNLDPGKIHHSISTNRTKQVTFHDKQVTKLLRDSAKKTFLPISNVDKLLGRQKKRNLKRKAVRKVTVTGPNLSESDSSDSDLVQEKNKLSSNVSSEDSDSNPLINTQIDDSQSQEKSDRMNIEEVSISKSDSDKHKIQSSSSGKSDSDDFEEVPLDNKLDPSSDEDFSKSKVDKISETQKAKDNLISDKTFHIDLNFNKPPSDEEDIFADVFQSPEKSQNKVLSNKPIMNKPILSDQTLNSKAKSEKLSSDEIIDVVKEKIVSDCVISNDRNISTVNETNESDDKKQSADEEDIRSDLSIVRRTSMQPDDENSYNLVKFVHSKEAERAVIQEELLIAKQKLLEEVGSVKSPSPCSAKYDNLEPIEEDKMTETQESLEEKKYFMDGKLELENPKYKEDNSPDSFAKKLSTVEQVRQFQSTLERESCSLIKDKRRDEKIAATLSEQITTEAKELLRLFGIPYVVAPMEAEAQCAFLDMQGLTQGTITDDSDIWLFGANNVYKNFFDLKKYVKLFKSSDIHRVYNLGRNELIMLGLLVGSDYTSGLNGVGPVTAMEILANFPQGDSDLFPPRDRLHRFATAFSQHNLPKKLTKKLLQVQLIEGFPSLEVVQAYTAPQIDENKETFSWGSPNMELIREYAMEKFGWNADKTDKTLEPIIDKLKQNKTQMTLHGFFDWAFEDIQGKMSKRVENAVNLMGSSPSKLTQQLDDDSPSESARGRAKRVLSEEKQEKKKLRNFEPTEEISSTYVAPVHGESMEGIASSSTANLPIAQFSSMDPFTPHIPSEPKSKKKKEPVIPMLRRVNATIEKIKKGKSLTDKARARSSRGTVSLTKPVSELDYNIPYGTGETRNRRKVHRTDEEKCREILFLRAKAAQIVAKVKKMERIHTDL